WRRAMKVIGMPEITLHSLRDTHASMLVASGMNILTISRRLGHASPTITLGTYGHLIHGTDDQAAKIMDQAFGNGSNRVADSGKKPCVLPTASLPVMRRRSSTSGAASAALAPCWMAPTTSRGVLAGTNQPCQLPDSKPTSPLSATVGTSGN